MFSISQFLQNRKITITTKVIVHDAITLETLLDVKWTGRLSARFYNVEFLARGAMFTFSYGARIFSKVLILKILNCIFK